MKSLYGRILTAFLLTFLLMYGTAAAVLFSGYNRSLSVWSTQRVASVEQAVADILRSYQPAEAAGGAEEAAGEGAGGEEPGGPVGLDERLVGLAVPVFVYDTQARLIASNRGVGRRREVEHTARVAVQDSEGMLLGYYATVAAQFHQDTANRALLESLVRALAYGGIAALSVAMAAAFVLSRMLAGPARQVAAGIDSLSAGIEHGLEVPPAVPEIGTTEIACIARATNSLAERLTAERSIRTQWSQDLAHDLRSPIASIRAQLEALVDGVYQAGPERIGRTLRELARVEGLIEDLEELMRLEQPELELSKTSIIGHEFIRSLLERFDHEVQRRHLTIDAHVEAESFIGDENLLYRAVSNLLSNAVRYSEEGGQVSVSLVRANAPQAGPAGVSIEVSNSGTPIAEHDLPHLFERLYRGEYARNSPGSGLGLTISRRIVLLHGGSMNVVSGPLSGPQVNGSVVAGTTVSIQLPVS